MQGFPERLIGEVKRLIPKDAKVCIYNNKRSKYGLLLRELLYVGKVVLFYLIYLHSKICGY